MSLPKTLKHAQERLDEAEGLMKLHADEVVQALTSETEYRGNYSGKMIENYVKADQVANNAETQFFNYENDFESVLEGDKPDQELINDYDILPSLQQYQHAFRSASKVSQRSKRLERQFEALSRIMKQNGMGDLQDRMNQEHPWYQEPEDVSGFQTAAEI